MSILKVENVIKKFGDHKVLDGINININGPGIYALIGPNGAGKTTLFNVISNLIKPTSGKIEVVDRPNTDSKIFYEVSFLKDNRVLYDYLSGYDHLSFIASAQKIDRNRINEVIDKLQISKYIRKKVGTYSLGMKQHLLIAMAILNKPKFLILDEPLNGLDPTSVIKVRGIFQELAKNGTAILISSHTLSEIDLMTNNILFLKNGKIIEEDEFIDNHFKYEILIPDESLEKIERLKDLYDYKLNGNILIIDLEDSNISNLIELLQKNDIKIKDIIKIKIGSEEKYMKMFPEEMEKIREYI
ncbi:ABC transporter ATP-binding protein [Helcococcus sueciensis]|uniref:ABC transporter ATP-binding protein n=1 Tax=Helcococcus sueciensis TaxID=241555 RepID=UPI0003FADA76|nr:ABC transporter ATP-binding protein [Helcococcus sueciensis]